jgi:hypothetical protein
VVAVARPDGSDDGRCPTLNKVAKANVRSAAKAGPICFPFQQLHAKSPLNAPQQTASLFCKQLRYSSHRTPSRCAAVLPA